MKKITLFFALLLFAAFNYTAQAAESQTSACTAGNLATVAASYLTTVTNLTVTGTIDARDFKTMRDAMPLLEVIDLSGSTVAAYSGTAGTQGATTTSYSANGVPAYAFCKPPTNTGKTSLKTFISPSSLSSIGHAAFYGCSGLIGTLSIPSSVTSIENFAFYGCSALTGSLTIPSSVTTIKNGAFGMCSGLTGSLTISSSITTVGNNAFSGCSGLTGSLTIPSSVTTIGVEAFSGCSGLTGSLAIPSSVTTIGEAAFNDCKGLTGSLTIPLSVTTISKSAFGWCKGFKGLLTIPSSVTIIGYYAFNNCSGLTGTLTIPSSVTTIEGWAFAWCTSFTGSLVIPPSVITIGDHAFWYTRFTGSLSIPSSVTAIGDYAFGNCSGLSSINAYAVTPIDIASSLSVFVGVNTTTCILHVPVGSKALYAAAYQWKDFTNIVEDIPISLNEVSSNLISIYPNPTNSIITISELGILVGDKTVTLSVVDVSGTTLLVKEVEPTTSTLSIDVSTFKNGIYFITVQTSNGSFVKRFVKE